MDWGDQRGIAPLFLVLVGVFVVLVVIGGVSFVAYRNAKQAVPVPENACQCSDLRDVENRMKEASAAVGAYAQLINGLGPAAQMYDSGVYAQGNVSVQAAVDAAHQAGAGTGTGTTDTACITRIQAPTECLRAALQTHENVHSDACQAAKASGAVGTYGDYKTAMTMANYWSEEIAGYTAELAYLGRNLVRIKTDPSCNPAPVAVETYPGAGDRQDQQERLAGAWRRVAAYVSGIV